MLPGRWNEVVGYVGPCKEEGEDLGRFSRWLVGGGRKKESVTEGEVEV